jgi:hypothetical protein
MSVSVGGSSDRTSARFRNLKATRAIAGLGAW